MVHRGSCESCVQTLEDRARRAACHSEDIGRDRSTWRPRRSSSHTGDNVQSAFSIPWLHAFVLWLEHEPVLDKESQEQIRARSNACGFPRAPRRSSRTGFCGGRLDVSAVGCFESPSERLRVLVRHRLLPQPGGFEGVVPLLVKADALDRPQSVCGEHRNQLPPGHVAAPCTKCEVRSAAPEQADQLVPSLSGC